jgi:GNAT superfamily N-acetyltransferase
VLAGLDGKTLISTAMVGHDGHRGWVYYLAVRPGFRGYGHGRAIMNASEAWLAERQVPKLNIMVRGANSAAMLWCRRAVALHEQQQRLVALLRRRENSSARASKSTIALAAKHSSDARQCGRSVRREACVSSTVCPGWLSGFGRQFRRVAD